MIINNLEIRIVPLSKTVYPRLEICAKSAPYEPYVTVTFHEDPTITVYYQDFDGLTVSDFIAAVELAGEFARRGIDWRPADA